MKARIIEKNRRYDNKKIEIVNLKEMYKIMENDTGELTTYFMTEPCENKKERILKILNTTINNNVVTNKAIFSCTIVFDESDFLWNIAFNLLNNSHRIV